MGVRALERPIIHWSKKKKKKKAEEVVVEVRELERPVIP